MIMNRGLLQGQYIFSNEMAIPGLSRVKLPLPTAWDLAIPCWILAALMAILWWWAVRTMMNW